MKIKTDISAPQSKERVAVKDFNIAIATSDKTSATCSQSSLKSSPVPKLQGAQPKMGISASTAKKLLFEDKSNDTFGEDQAPVPKNMKQGVPLYRKLTGRKEKTVF